MQCKETPLHKKALISYKTDFYNTALLALIYQKRPNKGKMSPTCMFCGVEGNT